MEEGVVALTNVHAPLGGKETYVRTVSMCGDIIRGNVICLCINSICLQCLFVVM